MTAVKDGVPVPLDPEVSPATALTCDNLVRT